MVPRRHRETDRDMMMSYSGWSPEDSHLCEAEVSRQFDQSLAGNWIMRALIINDRFVIHYYWHYWEVLETFGYWIWLEKVGSLEMADSLSWSLHFLSLPLMPEVRHLGLPFSYDAFCIITSHRQWIQSPSHWSQQTQHTSPQISVRVRKSCQRQCTFCFPRVPVAT